MAVGTQTNAQADDICKRLATEHRRVRGIRFAANSLRESDLGASIEWVWKKDKLPDRRCVAVGTTAKWGLINLDTPFDLMVVDEAWQMSWADFMLCSQVSERFVLIGDPGQIPPVVAIDAKRWETSPRAPHHAAPGLILEDPHIAPPPRSLPACRRLPADAVDLIRPFYDFAFESWAAPGDRAVIPGRRRGGAQPEDRPIDLLDGGSAVATTLTTPECGPPLERDDELAAAAAAIASRLLERATHVVDGEGKPARRLEPADIGISATHRIMNAALQAALPARIRSSLRVDTPERWQGLQCPVMIVVHPLSGVVHPSPFDLETGRLCVMASRHQAGMIVVTRDHVRETLETHIPSAEQAVGRPDIAGRGHHQHFAFWSTLEDQERVAPL